MDSDGHPKAQSTTEVQTQVTSHQCPPLLSEFNIGFSKQINACKLLASPKLYWKGIALVQHRAWIRLIENALIPEHSHEQDLLRKLYAFQMDFKQSRMLSVIAAAA